MSVYLFETKTKGDIDEVQLKRQLHFDLQTLFYVIALQAAQGGLDSLMGRFMGEIKGVRYNVVRRPLSGGKGTIRPHKEKRTKNKITPAEPPEAFYNRLSGIIEADPDAYFMRLDVTVTKADVEKFRRECLDPVLENMCDDFEWWQDRAVNGQHGNGVWDDGARAEAFPHHRNRHFRMPYGVHNPLLEGNASDLDEHLATGGMIGLRRTDDLFPELK